MYDVSKLNAADMAKLGVTLAGSDYLAIKTLSEPVVLSNKMTVLHDSTSGFKFKPKDAKPRAFAWNTTSLKDKDGSKSEAVKNVKAGDTISEEIAEYVQVPANAGEAKVTITQFTNEAVTAGYLVLTDSSNKALHDAIAISGTPDANHDVDLDPITVTVGADKTIRVVFSRFPTSGTWCLSKITVEQEGTAASAGGVAVEGITIAANKEDEKVVYVGPDFYTTFEATVEPDDANQNVIWSVSTPEDSDGKAIITPDGALYGLKAGKVKVTAKAADDSGVESDAIEITVKADNQIVIAAADYAEKLNVTPDDENSSSKTASVADVTVSAACLTVSAVAPGQTTILAGEGTMEAEIPVTVATNGKITQGTITKAVVKTVGQWFLVEAPSSDVTVVDADWTDSNKTAYGYLQTTQKGSTTLATIGNMTLAKNTDNAADWADTKIKAAGQGVELKANYKDNSTEKTKISAGAVILTLTTTVSPGSGTVYLTKFGGYIGSGKGTGSVFEDCSKDGLKADGTAIAGLRFRVTVGDSVAYQGALSVNSKTVVTDWQEVFATFATPVAITAANTEVKIEFYHNQEKNTIGIDLRNLQLYVQETAE